ncbi:unnamed protein product [Microthlaspi erraticum]|uniref:Uncharacterized protein n=1 Tax=Microthlaspi erraticum TaxID=1685480 RepID=A0A6D2IN87_9BRAS|nr:unnamed protein product [Microthlaspi erraticum]
MAQTKASNSVCKGDNPRLKLVAPTRVEPVSGSKLYHPNPARLSVAFHAPSTWHGRAHVPNQKASSRGRPIRSPATLGRTRPHRASRRATPHDRAAQPEPHARPIRPIRKASSHVRPNPSTNIIRPAELDERTNNLSATIDPTMPIADHHPKAGRMSRPTVSHVSSPITQPTY